MTKGVTVTWLGHGSFLIESPEGTRILVDPWYSGNPAFPEGWKERISADIDLILLTHGHSDHSYDIAKLAGKTGAPVATLLEVASWLKSKGLPEEQLIGYNKGGAIERASVRATLVQAQHSSSVVEDGNVVYLGEPCGFVLRFSNDYTIYFTGDTAVMMDMQLLGEIYKPDLVILPIGDFYTMGPLQAAHALRLIGAPKAIPCHYGTFPAIATTPEDLRSELAKLNLSAEVIGLEPGKSWSA